MAQSKTKPLTPSPDELFRRAEQRSIRSSVAMYTIKDLVCGGKLTIKSMDDFYKHVDTAYERLREISAGEASPNQKLKLVGLLRTCTLFMPFILIVIYFNG